jgi:membrane protease YdiL (CAAX protease family)
VLPAAAIFYLALAVVGVVWIGWRRGSIGLDLFLSPDAAALDLGIGLAAGLALAAAWDLTRRLVAEASRVEERLADILGPLERSEAVALALLSAIAEEFFFRGAVQGSWGYLPAAALFTLLHLGPGREYRLWTLFAGVAGLALGGLVAWRGSLASAIVAHALVNAVGLVRLSGGRQRGNGG